MNKILQNLDKISFVILLLIFFNTCGDPSKVTNKRINNLSSKIDSLQTEIINLKLSSVTKKDLQIEGLKSEKRMIQSTDRKILDVNRQSEIDRQIEQLQK